MKMLYPVIFTKENVGYSTYAIDLDGCFSEGDTFEEAYANTQNAIGLYLDGCDKYTMPSDPIKVSETVSDGQFMCIVEFDIIE